MSRADIAEWVLSLVDTPERAASTIGDLTEESESRGAVWFWSSLLWTACSQIWRILAASPWGMVGFAIWGLAATTACGLVLAIFLYWFAPRGFAVVDPIPLWIYAWIDIGAPLLAGWFLARRSSGRELPAAIATAMLFVLLRRGGIGRVHLIGQTCTLAVSVISGALLSRCRKIRSLRAAQVVLKTRC